MRERWCFTPAELKNPHDCNSEDEFAARDGEVLVLIQRNGKVTNRYADGTVGVTKEHADLADSDESPYSGEEVADNWRDVEVDDNDGSFLGFVKPQVWLVLGSQNTIRDNPSECLQGFTFDSQKEMDAFLLGVDLGCGWSECEQFVTEKEAKDHIQEICE